MNTNKRNVIILFFTMVVVMIGFGIIIPIMPFYVKQFNAGGSAVGGLMATYGLMQFLFAPLWGSVSDRVGRKPILMVGVFGNALAQLILGLSTQLWMLFAARALAGILSSATLPTAMAYIGDSSTHEERSGRMGLIGAAMGLGMVIGPGLGGILAKQALSTPFFLACGLSLLALLLIFLFLPESRQEKQALGTPGLGSLLQNFARQWDSMILAVRGPLGVLFIMAFLLSFGLTNFESVFGLYAQAKFNYDSSQVGMVLTVVGLISALIQGGATGPMTRKFGEVAVIRVALFSTAIGFLLLTLASSNLSVYLTSGYFVLSNAMLNPSVASLISKRSTDQQGMTQGLNNSFQSLGRVVGPLWAGNMFDLHINLPYLSGAVILFTGFVISLVWLGRFARSADTAAEVNQSPLSAN